MSNIHNRLICSGLSSFNSEEVVSSRPQKYFNEQSLLGSWSGISITLIDRTFQNPSDPAEPRITNNAIIALFIITCLVFSILFLWSYDLKTLGLFIGFILAAIVLKVVEWYHGPYRTPNTVTVGHQGVWLSFRGRTSFLLTWPEIHGIDYPEMRRDDFAFAWLVYGQRQNAKGDILDNGKCLFISLEIANEISSQYLQRIGRPVTPWQRRTPFSKNDYRDSIKKSHN